ncbi:MAG: hypothetical protein KA154_04265, partial [Gemmatimonadaceae bacterium]|nr:hypothetical protein [Gemmatimonadaceae bacterium]
PGAGEISVLTTFLVQAADATSAASKIPLRTTSASMHVIVPSVYRTVSRIRSAIESNGAP